MSELSEHLTQNPVDFAVETFLVDDDRKAEWALRKLKVAIERLDDINRQAVEEIAKVEDWRELVSKTHKQTVTYFENQLRDYMLRVRKEDEDRKSIVLPDGTIESRAVPAKASVSDRELVIKWALANNREGWVREKLEVNLEAMKGALSFSGESVIDSATGEIVEGLVAIEADVSVSVKVTT